MHENDPNFFERCVKNANSQEKKAEHNNKIAILSLL